MIDNISEIKTLAYDGQKVNSISTVRFLFSEILRVAKNLDENMQWLDVKNNKDDSE